MRSGFFSSWVLAGIFSLASSLAVAAGPKIYIAQNSAGADSGADCADAHNTIWFNNAANWGSATGKIGAGTTVHLCGTVTSELIFKGSGTSSNPITLLFEPGANMTSPDWGLVGFGAIQIMNQSWIVIDGGVPCGTTAGGVDSPNACNGIIQDTANGTGLANDTTAQAIWAFPCYNCEIKNLGIINIYVHQPCEGAGCPSGPENDLTTACKCGGTGMSIHDNLVHDTIWALEYRAVANADANINIYNNQIYNVDHGIAVWGGGVTWPGPVFMHDNHIHDFEIFDTGTGDYYHHDGIHVFETELSSIYIYSNRFDGALGPCCATAEVFLEGNTEFTPWTSGAGTAYLFNNIFTLSDPALLPSGTPLVGLYGGNIFAYNNTFIGPSQTSGRCFTFGAGSHGGSVVVASLNNVIESCQQIYWNYPGVTTFISDYNVFGNATSVDEPTACSGCDAHTQSFLSGPLPGLSSSGVPSAGFAGLQKGTNLTSTAAGNLSALAYDNLGQSRQSIGTWDVGAFAYSSSATAIATAGLRAALVYPNPVTPPYNPTIRICPGIVNSIDMTIFDVSGRVVYSSTDFAGPSTTLIGVGNGQYCYEQTWTGHKASGVYFAVVHAKASGTTVKARIKFAVVQ